MASNTGKPWTKKSDAKLRRLWGNVPDEAIAKELKRTEKELIDRAEELKLPPCVSRNTSQPWTPESIARLRLAWGDVFARGIRKLFGRTEGAIYKKATEIGLPPQSQGLVPMSAAAAELEMSFDGLKSVLIQCGVSVKAQSFVRETKRVGRRHIYIGVEVARECVHQYDYRTTTISKAAHYQSMSNFGIADRLDRFELRDRCATMKGYTRYPFSVIEEVVGGIEGPWCAVWRAVLAEGEMPFARWFIALAVYDTLYAEKAEREWIETVANQKALKIIADIVKKIRHANGPGTVRAVA